MTVDTGVIMIGSGMSTSGDVRGCVDLLSRIAGRRHVVIVVDDKDKVNGEYDRRMGASSTGRLWLKEMGLFARICG